SASIRASRASVCIQPIVFLAALPDQPHLARIRHDHFMPQLAEQATDPGRMRPDFQCDPTARQPAEGFLQCFPTRAHSLFPLNLAGFIHHAVPTVAVSQIQSNGQFLLRNIPALRCCSGANLLHCRSPFISCASSASITWERTASRRRPAFSSHLLTTTIRRILATEEKCD